MKLAVFALFFGITMAAPTSAEWRFDPTVPPSGAAIGGGQQTVMVVSCGNGGLPAFEITGSALQNPQEDFVLQIDASPEDLYFADCASGRCILDMDTMARAQSFMAQLRAGTTLDIGLYRRGALDAIGLSGSAAALDQLRAQGCGF